MTNKGSKRVVLSSRDVLMHAAENCQMDALGLLADEARDANDDALELGYRWLATNNRWPAYRWKEGGAGYYFWSMQGYDEFADNHQLPRDVWHGYVRVVRHTAELPGEYTFRHLLECAARQVGLWLKVGGI